MPTATLSRTRIAALLPPDVARGAPWEELLFASKAELESANGDDLVLSVTPDRLDLLSEGGLALYLAGAAGAARGLAPMVGRSPAPAFPAIEVAAAVAPLRGSIAGAIVRAPPDRPLDPGLLAEAVRFQELLHATIGRDRRAASLGIYPVDRVAPPVRYALEPLGSVRFVPLDGADEVDGSAFYRDHPMAARYGAFGRDGDRCLTLRDARDTVLSLPPVLNSRTAGEARPGDSTLLIESTGIRERSVREMVGLLLLPFVAHGWSAAPVPVAGPTGTDDGRSVLGPRPLPVPASVVRGIAGVALPSGEVEHRFSAARLGVRPHPGGWLVEVPAWRPDLLGAVDAAEEVVLSGGVRPEDGTIPPSRTRGRRAPDAELRRRLAAVVLGLGYAQPNTPVLLSESTVERLGGTPPIRLEHPVSAEFAYLRDRLLPSHLEVLAKNTRRGYPQRFAEIAPVVVLDPGAESGASTRYHLAAVVAADGAGFADAAALVDYLLRTLDVGAVREPAELPGTIPGRAARVRAAGEPIAEIGELHPALLESLRVPVPVAWAEVDVTALGPLLAPPGRP